MKSPSGKLKVDPISLHEHNSLMTIHKAKLKEINKKDLNDKVQQNVNKTLQAGSHLRYSDRFKSNESKLTFWYIFKPF